MTVVNLAAGKHIVESLITEANSTLGTTYSSKFDDGNEEIEKKFDLLDPDLEAKTMSICNKPIYKFLASCYKIGIHLVGS